MARRVYGWEAIREAKQHGLPVLVLHPTGMWEESLIDEGVARLRQTEKLFVALDLPDDALEEPDLRGALREARDALKDARAGMERIASWPHVHSNHRPNFCRKCIAEDGLAVSDRALARANRVLGEDPRS